MKVLIFRERGRVSVCMLVRQTERQTDRLNWEQGKSITFDLHCRPSRNPKKGSNQIHKTFFFAFSF